MSNTKSGLTIPALVTLIAAAIALFALTERSPARQAAAPVTAWEYLSVDVTFDGQGDGWNEEKLSIGTMRVRTRTSTVLDYFGERGWELVDSVGIDATGSASNLTRVVFKRPK